MSERLTSCVVVMMTSTERLEKYVTVVEQVSRRREVPLAVWSQRNSFGGVGSLGSLESWVCGSRGGRGSCGGFLYWAVLRPRLRLNHARQEQLGSGMGDLHWEQKLDPASKDDANGIAAFGRENRWNQ